MVFLFKQPAVSLPLELPPSQENADDGERASARAEQPAEKVPNFKKFQNFFQNFLSIP